MTGKTEGRNGRWPLYGWLGLTLVAVFWVLNWSLLGLRTHWGFFPLWLGYALTVDALVFLRKGNSLLTRNPAAYAGLFLVSAPAWWLFELINLRTQNWIYLGEEAFTTLEYAVLSTVSFSTVMPAVFGTAELAGTCGRLRRIHSGPAIAPTPALLRGMFAAGCVMLLLLLLWPDLFFPLVWIAVYCLIEPLNVKMENRSLFGDLARGDWTPVISLGAGCLICGFFWEMWNFLSYPKWVYRIPYAAWFHVFEMPLPGYLGYLPFSLELFALYHLVTGPLLPERNRRYLRLTENEP
ncbi:MAG: hypothetical protein C0390_00685 [Syntrophus sp. (in: bacteria)]|nr:hypothetical protein [Syntrophus sp. (in: bacteria)]